jgi:hypothetical protein
MRTDFEYWEKVVELIPDFMDANYTPCEGWKCGVIASVALRNFHKFVAEKLSIETSTISYHTFYNALRGLGYDIPVVKGGYDANKTKIKGIARREV